LLIQEQWEVAGKNGIKQSFLLSEEVDPILRM